MTCSLQQIIFKTPEFADGQQSHSAGTVCRGLTRRCLVVSPTPKNPGKCVVSLPTHRSVRPRDAGKGAARHTRAVWAAGRFLGDLGLMIYLLGPAQRGPQTPGLAVLNRSKLDRVCRRKALESSEASSVPDRTDSRRAWLRTLVDFSRLCESRGGRPGLPSLTSLRFLWT